MGIPVDPAVSDIVTEGLKKGGRVNPSSGDITDATNIHFQEVKSDIYLKSPRHFSLVAGWSIPTVVGQSRYNWPTFFEDIRSIQLIDAPTSGSYNATAQAGGASTITLNAAFSDTATPSPNTIGRFVFLTGGTGVGQYAQITGYNDSTKVATIEATWASLQTTLAKVWVPPDNTTSYLIENIRYKLWSINKPWEFDTQAAPFQQGTPTRSCLVDKQIWLDLTPDRVYQLLVDFWLPLDRLDETDTLFVAHMRKFRSLWTQGVAAKVAQRFDDRRAPEINAMYSYMLDLYGATSSSVGQMVFTDY
jgi:hypothetical protein